MQPMPNAQTPEFDQHYDIAEVERKVAKAKALLILDHPFWGTAVSKRPAIYTDAVPTAGVSAQGQMYLNPAFVATLNVKKIMFLLAHEAMHYMLGHAFRRKHREQMPWNIACDKVINDTLIDAKVGEFIDGGVTLRDARNYAAEELYDENDDDLGGIGADIGDPVDENGNPLDESQVHALEAQAKIEMIQSAKAAKATGNYQHLSSASSRRCSWSRHHGTKSLSGSCRARSRTATHGSALTVGSWLRVCTCRVWTTHRRWVRS